MIAPSPFSRLDSSATRASMQTACRRGPTSTPGCPSITGSSVATSATVRFGVRAPWIALGLSFLSGVGWMIVLGCLPGNRLLTPLCVLFYASTSSACRTCFPPPTPPPLWPCILRLHGLVVSEQGDSTRMLAGGERGTRPGVGSSQAHNLSPAFWVGVGGPQGRGRWHVAARRSDVLSHSCAGGWRTSG